MIFLFVVSNLFQSAEDYFLVLKTLVLETLCLKKLKFFVITVEDLYKVMLMKFRLKLM